MTQQYPQITLEHECYHPSEAESRARAFEALLKRRRSVRAFASTPVPKALIAHAIQTASTAPSGANQQPWTFVAVSDPGIKREIREAAEAEEYASYHGRMPDTWRDALAPLGTTWEKPYLEVAPWLVVVFQQTYGLNEDGSRKTHYYVKESVGIACGLFIAALHNMGLCTLTHTPSPMGFLSEILKRPKHEKPYILFPVGYPEAGVTVPDIQKKSLAEVSAWWEA